MPDQVEMTLYSLHRCPYCAAVRMRLGQLGLSYELREVPARRSQRKEVQAVSGQPTVPVLVVRAAEGEPLVLSDENEILGYLDEHYAARAPLEPTEPWGEVDDRALRSAVENLDDLSQQLAELAQGAASAGNRDRFNVLTAASQHVALAHGWTARQLEEPED